METQYIRNGILYAKFIHWRVHLVYRMTLNLYIQFVVQLILKLVSFRFFLSLMLNSSHYLRKRNNRAAADFTTRLSSSRRSGFRRNM